MSEPPLERMNSDQRSKSVSNLKRPKIEKDEAGRRRKSGLRELIARRARGQNALKSNDNLDLESYDPHIKEFCTYSQNMFAVQNIFTDKK